jgi:DNA modification methylase
MLEQLSMFVDEDEIIEEDFQIVFNDSIKVEYGDIFELGVHRLMCGDATIKADVEKLMGGCKVDLFLTDPPYNVDYGKTDENLFMMNDKMPDSEFRLFLRNAFYAADKVMKPGAVFYIWHANLESYNFNGACRDIEWKVRQCLIWNKSSFVMGRRDYHWIHEPCLYGWKEGAAHKWCSDRKQTTVMNFDKPIKSPEHPTMKQI